MWTDYFDVSGYKSDRLRFYAQSLFLTLHSTPILPTHKQDNWILSCGPLTDKQYISAVAATGGIHKNKVGLLTRCAFDLAPQHSAVKSSLTAGTWRWKGGLTRPGTGAGVDTDPFFASPSNASPPIHESAELYIQNKTNRLFVALDLGDAISLARAASRGKSNGSNMG